MRANQLDLIDKQVSLIMALKNGRSDGWCLRLWSRFIKARDDHQCVLCGSSYRVQAHHILRKSLYPYGWFQPGNGITLCQDCHDKQLSIFNSRPNFNLPVNAQGGDNLDDLLFYFDLLIKSANVQGLDHDKYYYIDDHMLLFIMHLQQHEPMHNLLAYSRHSRLSIACEIWRRSPPSMLAALISANR